MKPRGALGPPPAAANAADVAATFNAVPVVIAANADCQSCESSDSATITSSAYSPSANVAVCV